MSRFERGFHSLTTVQEHAVPKIYIDLGLPPYVNTDKIGINIRRIHNMMRLGGISNLSVTGTSGETSTNRPSVVGISPDGSAYAGKSTTAEKVSTYSVTRDPSDDHSPNFIAGRWANAQIKVNLDEVGERMRDRGEPLRSEGGMGRELDYAIRNGLAEAGTQHLIFDTNVNDMLSFAFNSVGGTGVAVYNYEGTDDALPLPGAVALVNVAWHGVRNISDRINYREEGYQTEGFRWSLVSGPQLDRAAVLNGMAQPTKVVKRIESKRE